MLKLKWEVSLRNLYHVSSVDTRASQSIQHNILSKYTWTHIKDRENNDSLSISMYNNFMSFLPRPTIKEQRPIYIIEKSSPMSAASFENNKYKITSEIWLPLRMKINI